MVPVAVVLTGALFVTAVIDVLRGHVPLVGETTHLPELLSVVLLWLLAKPSSRGSTRSAGVPPRIRLKAVGDETESDGRTGP